MKKIWASTIFLGTIISAQADEMCPLENANDLLYTDITCQFYLGTTAYRAQVYEIAAAHWLLVADSEANSAESSELISTATSTLSYLKYYGLGMERDRPAAVEQWQFAARQGSVEAYSQLGHAYLDEDFEEYDPIESLAWYLAAKLKFADTEVSDETDKAILDDISMRAESLKSDLTSVEITKAERVAAELIS